MVGLSIKAEPRNRLKPTKIDVILKIINVLNDGELLFLVSTSGAIVQYAVDVIFLLICRRDKFKRVDFNSFVVFI